MEQKQLDELEDSFFGEEFIEDTEDLPPATSSKSQEIKIEPREQAPELRLHKMHKKSNSLVKKSVTKKNEKNEQSAAVKPKETLQEKRPVAVEKASEQKEPQLKDKKSSEPSTKKETVLKKETVTVNIKPAKESARETIKEVKPTVETSSPVNPWEDDEKSPSLFKETSTWKALTGVALVLLVLSLFTQGFNFSEKDAVTGAATVSLQEAEQKVLGYVNTQLLQSPFQAELQSSEELDALYKVTLAVAGQTVDSYVTKDGALFFPQGLDMNKNVLGNEVGADPKESNSKKELEVAKEEVPKELEVEVEPETTASSEPELAPETSEDSLEKGESSEESSEKTATGETVKLTLNAKKWVFQPNVLRVKKGSKVVLTVVPNGLDFTFAVPSLGVEEKVVGTTEVVFTADKAGTFDFTCGSCEDWRGMRGNLVVESSK